MAFHKDLTGANLHEPKPHKDSHDPADGVDPLDTAAAAEIAGVQVAGAGSAHSYARSDHVHAINHGITDNHLVTVDGASNQPVSGDYAKWTVNGLEGRSAAEVRSDINVEDGADVTDATNVDAAGAVMEADYDANTILAADADNTPTARTIGEDELVGRLSGGNIGAVTAAQARALVNLATITKTLTGTEAMAATVNVRAWYDPGGADREVDLPPEAAGVVEIVNTADADETLTIKDDSATDTIGVVGQGCAGRFVCDGTTWRMLQLRYIAGDFKITGDLAVGGAVSAGDAISVTDGTDLHVIKAVQEPGLGGRLTIGLDETARSLVICDAGDVDTDLGLTAQPNPALFFASASLNDVGFIQQSGNTFVMDATTFGASTDISFRSDYGFNFIAYVDMASGNYMNLARSSGVELTDTDGEQSWLYVEPAVNQSATAGYNAIKIDVTETALGDGSAGQGNNLIWAGVGGTVKAEIDNTGNAWFANDCSALSFTDRTPHFEGDAVAELTAIKSVDGEIDHSTLPAFARKDRIKKITTRDPEVECDSAEALEEYDAEVPDYDLIQTTDAKTGAEKTVKKLRVLEYKTKAFKLQDDGTIFEEKEPVYQTKTVRRKRVREGYRFDESTGKFYKLGKTTSTEETIPGRDLGALISMLTVAVQQLDARLKKLEPIVAEK